MSYTITKLSEEDKIILQDIFEELESIHIPTTMSNTTGTFHANKTGAVNQKDARQTCFGLITYRGEQKKSKSTLKYPWMMSLFKKFIKSHYPKFKFKSIFVNRNVVCKKHLDSKNAGESLLVGVGPYKGGRTVLYLPDGEKKFHIKSQSLIFNGSEIEHKTEDFKGCRYSLVFFK